MFERTVTMVHKTEDDRQRRLVKALTEDQTAVIDFLASSSAHGGATVERIDTHSAIVFLAGERAYKLKRAVRFEYLDFSTTERRRAMCDAEMHLNRRTAPTLYRAIVPITRERDGTIALGGTGTPIDWVVEMHRFPQEALFDRLAADGRLALELMPPLATAIGEFHAAAERRRDHGGRSAMAWVIEGNAAGFDAYGMDLFDPAACRQLTAGARVELDAHGALLDQRRVSGFVRQCHGDLHLRNIVLLDGQPTLFDGVEFDDRIACTDVLYDLAFLLMDLWRRRLTRHANVVLNRYLADARSLDAVSLLPLFLSCRAAVRAKTSATAATLQHDAKRRDELHALAREYLAMADGFLHPPQPCVVAIGGFSGSGKSTLALGLAPSVGAAPGAVVVRSDEIRKQLSGVASLDRLGPERYSPEMSNRVYATAVERARAAVRHGHSAIVDAVFARPDDRRAIERVAADVSVPFIGLWLEAPESMLITRTEGRRNDASDADAGIIRTQHRQGTDVMTWHRVGAATSSEIVLDYALKYVQKHLRGGGNAN
jgi:aminoglycoside phosphotransferase family enzyme/predicted kinase